MISSFAKKCMLINVHQTLKYNSLKRNKSILKRIIINYHENYYKHIIIFFIKAINT